jgi:hypothetical protein
MVVFLFFSFFLSGFFLFFVCVFRCVENSSSHPPTLPTQTRKKKRGASAMDHARARCLPAVNDSQACSAPVQTPL